MISPFGVESKLRDLKPAGFVRWVHESLGLTRDNLGRPSLRDKIPDGKGGSVNRMLPEEFGLRTLAESMVGREWVASLQPDGNRGHSYDLLEAGANAAIQPSAFNNISAFNATVGGLLEVKVLEEYRRPVFIADRLARNIPTRQRSEKLPATSRIGDKALTMNPSDPHPRAQFGERYVTTPETQKRGLAIDVTKEAVFFDLTNQVLMRAEEVGYELGLRKEKLVLDCVMGLTNTYSYRGTGYSTYLTSGNWINDHANQLIDWTDLDAADQLFAAMTDQEASERIVVAPNQMLVMPYKAKTAAMILGATNLERRTDTSAQVAHTFNPYGKSIELLSSAIAMQRLTDSAATGGGALSATNAKDYWFYGELNRAFGYMENWAMNVVKANPTDYMMADYGLVLSVFADEMGIPTVLEPRYAVRNKDS